MEFELSSLLWVDLCGWIDYNKHSKCPKKRKKCLPNSNVDCGNCFSQNGYCSDLIRVIAKTEIMLPNYSLSVYTCVFEVSFCDLHCLNRIRRNKPLDAIIMYYMNKMHTNIARYYLDLFWILSYTKLILL